MAQLAFSSNVYWKICFEFCILEQITATVLFICISSINNKGSLIRFQSTTAPTNRGWSACGYPKSISQGSLGTWCMGTYIVPTLLAWAQPYLNFFCLLPCYYLVAFPLLLCHLVTLSPCFDLLLCCSVTLFPCYLVPLLPCYSFNLFPGYSVALLPCYPVTLLLCCSIP